MKFLAVFAVALAVAAADVSHVVEHKYEQIPIVKSNFDHGADGSYNYGWESGNGISAQAEGIIKDINSEHPASEVKGAFAYTSPEGQPIQVTYIANENGYQPQGDHLPTAPPVPEAILRSLHYLAEHPQAPAEYVAKNAGVVAKNAGAVAANLYG